MRRVPTPELLDSDAGTPLEIAASLRDLDRINRWFGGVSTAEYMLTHIARHTGQHKLNLLEVAAGAGDVPVRLRQRLAPRGIDLEIVMLDRSASHLNGCCRSVAGDALALPFRDSSFDLVSSSLFVHHLAPDEVVRCAEEALRVCRTAVLINDLIRHPIHLLLNYAGLPLFSHITRHDSIASVKQAYTLDEMFQMLTRTSVRKIEITRHYLFRMGVIAWKGTHRST
jgi:ubiquinone/menaquinone biosynthesis C-methylase UbiE